MKKTTAVVLPFLLTAWMYQANGQEKPSSDSMSPSQSSQSSTTKAQVNIDNQCRLSYPPEAERYHLQGKSYIAFLVDANENLVTTKIIKSSGWKLLDNAAMYGLSKCSFKPATKDGRPIEAWTKIAYNWKLSDEGNRTVASLVKNSCAPSDQFALINADLRPVPIKQPLIRLLFLVDEKGHPHHFWVEDSSGSKELDDSAIEFLQSCSFTPETLNKNPVEGSNSISLLLKNKSCPMLEEKDIWQYRNAYHETGKPSQINYIQFQVLFRNAFNSVAIEHTRSEAGELERYMDSKHIHHVDTLIPQNACLLDLFDEGSISTRQPSPYPLKKDDQWVEDATVEGTNIVGLFKVAGQEDLTVKAGTFTTIKIDVVTKLANSEAPEKQTLPWFENHCTYWYSEKVKAMAKTSCDFYNQLHDKLFSEVNELSAYEVAN